MNDIEKAIKDLDYLKNCDSISSNYFKSIHGKYLELAVEALEKQIPKKVSNKAMHHNCPSCFSRIEIEFTDYCPDCGQRLEWEE